ncbi:MAG TPA: amino acid ABC transporter substrate-binding protein [Stellaceae bacterium]|nr:amino acid ABC transporter substrate-binding protein [Stellaceae bacterium]
MLDLVEPKDAVRSDVTRRAGLSACVAAGLALLALGVPAVFAPPVSAQDTGPIKIGLAITQTGPFSPPASYELRGYELAVDQINKSGGLLGRQLQIVKYDDQGNPATAVQLYQKLLTDDRVDLLLSPYQTDLVGAVAPVVNRAKKVMPSLAANVEHFEGKYPYLIQSMTQTSRYMAPIIDLAAAKGYKTIAILVQNTQFPQQLAQGIEEKAKEKGLTVVFKETYAPTTTDFSALVLKASEAKPDVIIGATYLADAQGIVRAAKSQNVQAKMFAFSIGPVEPEFYKGLGTAAETVFGTTLYFKTLKTKGNVEFVAAFREKYNLDPTYHAAVAYASMKVFGDVIKKVGSLDQDKIRAEFVKTAEETVVGHYELDQNGKQLGYGSYALQWLNGQQELVWPKADATTDPVLPHPGWK